MSSPSGEPPPKESLVARSISGSHPGQLPVQPEPDYSGIWVANDGGWYFLWQLDTDLWWVGVSAGQLCPGLEYCNVYHASVTGPNITGDWSDVPRGATSNGGSLALALRDDNVLYKVSDTGGFGPASWQRSGSSPWPVISLVDAFQHTLKNVVGNADTSDKQSLYDNLLPLKAPVTVFASIANDDLHLPGKPVSVNYPNSDSSEQDFSYHNFICAHDPEIGGGWLHNQDDDGDATFMMQAAVDQIAQRQPFFFDGVPGEDKDTIESRLTGADVGGFEGEMLMFGRAADCNDDGAETSSALFPGWAERADGSVLFNGKPISITDFVAEIVDGDLVRVTGALIFDHGHGDDNPQKLEIHPVYSVDKITATLSGLSGGWADDVGNTYYLRHDPADNTVWYVALSPPGSTAFAQVFRGTFYPPPASKVPAMREAVSEDSVAPAGNREFPSTPQNVLTGDVVAIDLGWGTAAPFEESGTRLGDTGPVTFEFSSAELVTASGGPQGENWNILELSMGDFRLIKLYDA
jgi:hypothetical protein